uniref:Aromatic amino acid beta-eliminating lyase/threonine aldolase domain-containing protein n=1 Tax=viral metagenome TaxID=1070528 RepID=A0A6C0E887_9ZZZZ
MYNIDLRSDTVTQPSDEMRQSVLYCSVGDDVFGEDPTINELQETAAKLFNKESALFFPSGTMSNLAAILSWCPKRSSEIIVGDKSHIFLYEQCGASQFGGVSLRTVPNLSDGSIDMESIGLAIRDDDIHEPITSLICIENTHNACGGQVLPFEFLQNLKMLSLDKNIPIHLDGARIWNALTYMNKPPQEIGEMVDSLTVCLSKGLGAPIGSLLIGPTELIQKAKRIRKALGGGMRQSGVIGSMGLIALKNFNDGILLHDHNKCKLIADSISQLDSFRIKYNIVTNIIFIDILSYDKSWKEESISSEVALLFKEKGIRVSAWSPKVIRIVLHKDINDLQVEYIIKIFIEISNLLSG